MNQTASKANAGSGSGSSAQEYPAPQCDHWMIGNFFVAQTEERGDQVKYERAILVTFKTIDEFRAALKYMDPIFNGDESSSGERK